jgi:response regulator RpfG family c-di-GMP phosphodiesterase
VRETAAAASATALEPHDLSGLRVLVTDDDPDVVEMVKRVLEESGAEVLPGERRGSDRESSAKKRGST